MARDGFMLHPKLNANVPGIASSSGVRTTKLSTEKNDNA